MLMSLGVVLTVCRIAELRRILVAYSVYDSELGYCQGLNFIAFMLLIHLEEAVSLNIIQLYVI